MEPFNAFIGHKQHPSPDEVTATLGPAACLWNQLIHDLESKLGVAQEWSGVCAHKYGWSLILVRKKRRIAYLGPCQCFFKVSFILSDKAVAAAKQANLPKRVLEALAEAPHYPEGTGLRLTVRKPADLPAIEKVAGIKLAN